LPGGTWMSAKYQKQTFRPLLDIVVGAPGKKSQARAASP
jgi:hypothetical protein